MKFGAGPVSRSLEGVERNAQVFERVLICLWQSSVKNVFIRGSVVRYVHLPAAAVDTPLLEDATRRGMAELLNLCA